MDHTRTAAIVEARVNAVKHTIIMLLSRYSVCSKVEVDVKEAVDAIVELPGMTDGLRDDIFAAYSPLGAKDTLLDVQRAVTAAAHAVRELEPEKAIELEKLGGRIIEQGKAALALK
jgi:hypothetical protein